MSSAGQEPLAAALERLWQTVLARRGGDPAESYTARLFARGRQQIAKKLGEEAIETALAAVGSDPAALVAESADLLYHLLVLWAETGIDPHAVAAELDRRVGTSGLDEKKARRRDG